MILALRTDKPEAELYLYDSNHQLIDSYKWQAHRELSNTLLENIENLLEKNNLQLQNLSAMAVYQGPGSFTGLRIGISVINTLGYSLRIPIAGGVGEKWIQDALNALKNSKNSGQMIVPEYGAAPNITAPRK